MLLTLDLFAQRNGYDWRVQQLARPGLGRE
jgi:hypothetical protein